MSYLLQIYYLESSTIPNSHRTHCYLGPNPPLDSCPKSVLSGFPILFISQLLSFQPPKPFIDSRVSKLWLEDQFQANSCFCKMKFFGTQPCVLLYILSMTTFAQKQQSFWDRKSYDLQSLKYLPCSLLQKKCVDPCIYLKSCTISFSPHSPCFVNKPYWFYLLSLSKFHPHCCSNLCWDFCYCSFAFWQSENL